MFGARAGCRWCESGRNSWSESLSSDAWTLEQHNEQQRRGLLIASAVLLLMYMLWGFSEWRITTTVALLYRDAYLGHSFKVATQNGEMRRIISNEKDWLPVELSSVGSATQVHLLGGVSRNVNFRGVTTSNAASSSVVTEIKALVTRDEVRHLIEMAKRRFKRSTTVGGVHNPIRTSFTAHLDKSEDDTVERIEKRVCELTKLPWAFLEPLQVVRYRQGQQYRPHHDYFEHVGPNGSQRTISIFVYLQSVSETCGGATFFPELNLRFKPDSGDALMWSNVKKKDATVLDPSTLHGGEPVTCDEIKYGLNVWFRNKEWK